MSGVKLRKIYTANSLGLAHQLALFVGPECPLLVQVLDEETCTVTAAKPLSPYTHWNETSFTVGSGPDVSTNPPVYNCLEACVEIYGNTVADWECSRSPVHVDNLSYASTWGSFVCLPFAEDYSMGTNYDCGTYECSTSAYVRDKCAGFHNYCHPK